MQYGYVKVSAAIPLVSVADTKYNIEQMIALAHRAYDEGAEITVFPELCITGYTCGDLFTQQTLLLEAETAIAQFAQATSVYNTIYIIGAPIYVCGALYNCALVVQQGKILGIVPKSYIPNHGRWFSTGYNLRMEANIQYAGQSVHIGSHQIFHTGRYAFGVEISEDLWSVTPPSSTLTLEGAEIIFNLSAADEGTGKHDYLRSLIAQQSARCMAGYVYSSCGYGESTTDLVFAGKSFVAENGSILAEGKRFCLDAQLLCSEIDIDKLRMERRGNSIFTTAQANSLPKATHVYATPISDKESALTRTYSRLPFVPQGDLLDAHCNDILNTQVAALAKRLSHIHCSKVVIGISGGLDSTLALLATIRTFDRLQLPRTSIIGITMPGFGTTDRTYQNALSMMEQLGISQREISIKDACIQHFSDIGHDINIHDTTYENGQARERTQLLMDVANRENAIVIGTGDLSELALGWATYNGDHMSMYGINAGIPKTLVRHLVEWEATHTYEGDIRRILLDVVNTPISPELIPAKEDGTIKQKTEDLVGPYELHDFFIYHFIRSGYTPSKIFYIACCTFEGEYSKATIKKWLTTFFRRFFQQQFKRSCLPDGPKVGSVSLSPRGDWHMPSDASAAHWIEECEQLSIEN
ncbi:MAG: NAD(+) synthase [Bacteroidaceae bacterium]|nr:NAD(+) synthase [Bacteroidaceae bacterium]